jgi:hypothetical protein
MPVTSPPRTNPRTPPDDLAQLRQDHPGWTFGTVWTTVGSGPDQRRIVAIRDGIILSAWSAEAVAADIRREES